MIIETRLVHSEEDLITVLSKQNNQKVIPGKNYLYTPRDLNIRVVFSSFHWQFCGKEIKVIKTTERFGYDYISAFADNGVCPLWRKEWFVIPNELDHSLCNWSSGIHEGLTVGQGKLDSNGYWEYPCYTCARKHEELYPKEGPIWPFK